MTPAFDRIRDFLRRLPGLGSRSAERLALHLFVERPESVAELAELLRDAGQKIHSCGRCGNITETDQCSICADESRNPNQLCVVESVLDLLAMDRSGVFKGRYHVLHGRLSPLHDIGPEQLNLEHFAERLDDEAVDELILALPNDIEAEATCHYLVETYLESRSGIKVSRIGFGLPSGGGLTFADPATLRSALEARRDY